MTGFDRSVKMCFLVTFFGYPISVIIELAITPAVSDDSSQLTAVFIYNAYVTESLLQTKLYIPPLRPNLVPRSRLFNRLNRGLHEDVKLILISAPAGFGKTSLITAWAGCWTWLAVPAI